MIEKRADISIGFQINLPEDIESGARYYAQQFGYSLHDACVILMSKAIVREYEGRKNEMSNLIEDLHQECLSDDILPEIDALEVVG